VTLRPNPLEPELEALLDAERDALPSGVALDRVWSNVERSVALGVAAQTTAGSPKSTNSTNVTGSMSGVSGTGGWVATHVPVLLALAFGTGLGAGATATIALRAPAPRIVYVDRPVAPPAPSPAIVAKAPVAPTADVAPDVASEGVSRPRASAARAVPVPSSFSSLPAERAILDGARTALGQNDGARAIALTDEHARRFPHPQLGEEREAIAIQALVIAGRYDDARERARQFRAASPDSLFLPVVEASLASIP
jgi:hypothetical protein